MRAMHKGIPTGRTINTHIHKMPCMHAHSQGGIQAYIYIIHTHRRGIATAWVYVTERARHAGANKVSERLTPI